MDAREFDIALTELETRVDRLRALYENWFRGYEKTEPSVARKDVERRVYGMRKELPRNTALRFRYHQLYQRYTTLANYWQRTARQIEEGTYRLQLQRVKRKRVEGETRRSLVPDAASADGLDAHNGYALDPDETLDVSKLLNDLDLDEVGRALEPAPRTDKPAPRPTARFARPSEASARPSQPDPLPLVQGGRAPEGGATAPTPAGAGKAGTFKVPPLEAPAMLRPSMPQPSLRASMPPPPARASVPMPPVRASVPQPPPGASMAPPRAPVPPQPGPLVGVPRPPTAGTPSLAPGHRPPPPPPRPSLPERPPAAAAGEALAEPRLRRIYDEYSAARRKNNEGEVRYETLASSIQKMLPELRKKHAGKQIDFEVVLKDGRVGLKPKAT